MAARPPVRVACLVLVVFTTSLALMSGALASPGAHSKLPYSGSPPKHISVWFTDTRGRPIRQTSLGDVIRIHSSWGRVCVHRTNGDYCANPHSVPSVLQRMVRPNLVIRGRVRAFVGNFSVPQSQLPRFHSDSPAPASMRPVEIVSTPGGAAGRRSRTPTSGAA